MVIDHVPFRIKDLCYDALAFVLSEFEANGEPTPRQVSKAAGMDSRQLGKALSKLGIRSKPVRRGGKNFRIYPLALKARVKELVNT
jgi:hypothetical protein